jgi:hypothetical protein
MMAIDTSELTALGAELLGGTAKRRALISTAVKKGAQNVKDNITADLDTSTYSQFKRIHIGYELQTVGMSGIAADISPDKGGASSLANIAFFGTATGGYATRHKFYEHAEEELPTLAKYVEKAGTEALFV